MAASYPNLKFVYRPFRRWLWLVLLGLNLGGLESLAQWAIAQPAPSTQPTACPQLPALKRLQSHRVKPGETLTQIAERYGLLSATLMGMNPALRNGQVTPGQTLLIPPYNGIQVSMTGQTLQSVAKRYNVRPDVLFEVNGCQKSPAVVFVPGVNWTPSDAKASATPTTDLDQDFNRDRYPLPQPAEIKQAYGWQPIGVNNAIVFSSGVHLGALSGTPVSAVADGTIAFAGPQKPWDGMVVINHSRGRQTRYGYLANIKVQVGQQVKRGQIIGSVSSNTASVLRFELRNRSSIGWIAQNPQSYLQAIAAHQESAKNRSN